MFIPENVGFKVSRHYGTYALVYCRWHSDRHASGIFNKVTGNFFCNACKTSKKAKDLMSEEEFVEAVPLLPTFSSDSKRTATMFSSFLKSQEAMDYISSRGISEATASFFDVRWSSFESAIVFPMTEGYGMRPIAVEDGPRYFYYGRKDPLWNLEMILATAQVNHSTPLIMCEGAFKAMKMFESMSRLKTNVTIGATMGSMMTKELLEIMTNWNQISMVCDNDEAGIKFGNQLKRHGVRCFVFDSPYDEIDENEADEHSVFLKDKMKI